MSPNNNGNNGNRRNNSKKKNNNNQNSNQNISGGGASTPNLNLFKQTLNSAVSSGVISPQTSALLTGNLGNIVIAGAAGADLEDIQSSDVTLITVLLDASSSIGSAGVEQAVRDGYNTLLDTFACSRERDSILLALWTFNTRAKVVHSYVPVVDAASLDASNYVAGGVTHLYDTWCDSLAANVAYAEQLRAGGTPCRSLVVVITDGEDIGSKHRLKDCKQLSQDLLASEQFVLAFVGVGGATNFHRIAKGMGVPDNCVSVQTNVTPTGLRQMFQMVSQSAIQVSRSQIAPSQGGFFH